MHLICRFSLISEPRPKENVDKPDVLLTIPTLMEMHYSLCRTLHIIFCKPLFDNGKIDSEILYGNIGIGRSR